MGEEEWGCFGKEEREVNDGEGSEREERGNLERGMRGEEEEEPRKGRR